MFPALVNCTTIDWFSEWPNDALKEVAMKYLQDVDLGLLTSVVSILNLSLAEISIKCIARLLTLAFRFTC